MGIFPSQQAAVRHVEDRCLFTVNVLGVISIYFELDLAKTERGRNGEI